MHFTLALLPLLASVNAAITILYPTSNTIWYKNDTVALNWTVSDPSTDTYLFRAILSNQDASLLSSPQQIADSTNATATYVRIALPGVPPGQGYKVALVNTTNQSQVFAQSEAFEIQNGIFANQTSTSAIASATSARSSSALPNAQSSQASFPSASAAHSSGAATPGALPSLGLFAQAAALVGLAGGAAAVLF
ncbi:hypothetical protein DB88DRAFT_497595 [Papiliotrema laurentii]|uniref:Yeast cell wall synthesis Kre9/Knh1-like N-terminal domain-containing protein n=1 Tax=Papiliotrema laurentii TaxID=5418 RepID=A0AAD9FK45_PAPLA|nr:hypothetical protein DB88DRAFT_497595 [Papiliotrema laurentii]